MRKTGICTKCSYNRLLHVIVADATQPVHRLVEEMHLAVFFVGEGFSGEKRASVGKLSAVVCRSCGYTEFYVRDPEVMQPDGRYIHELNGPEPTGPFR